MIAVVFALEFEAADFVARYGRRLSVDVWILGFTGRRAAEALERRLKDQTPELIVSAGFGGSLQPGYPIGKVVLGTNFTDTRCADVLGGAESLASGAFVTSPDILVSAQQKRALGESTGACVGDMETAHIAEICRARGIPLVAIRSISDTCEEDLPVPGDVLVNPATSRPDPALLFRYLFKHPRAAMGMKKLVENAHCARRTLAVTLQEILPRLARPANVSRTNPAP